MERSGNNETATQPRWRVYALFALCTIGAALGNLSQTGLNAMLPSTMAEFGVDVDVGQWFTTGYMLVLGVAVPIATFLMQRLNDRRYLLVSNGIFLVGSLLSYVSPEYFSMLLGRILQAVAVGLFIPKNQAIAMTKFAPGHQATAMGVAGIALGFAPSVAPTLGGAMDYAFGWRSFFLLLSGVSLLLLLLTIVLVPSGDDGGVARFETLSFVLSTFGFGGVLLGLSQASTYGFASAWVWVPMVIGVVCIVLFVRRQGRVEYPLMDLGIFKSRKFVDGLVASVFLFACYMGVTLVIPLYVQDVLGGTSLDAGLVTFPTVFTAILVNPLSGILADKTSHRLSALVFTGFLATGAVLCTFVSNDTPLWMLSIWQTIRAIGVSGSIGPLLTYALSGLEGRLVPHGSSASVIIRQVAATFGTAIMVFCIAVLLPLAASGDVGAAVPYQAAFGFSALMGVLCLGTVILRVK